MSAVNLDPRPPGHSQPVAPTDYVMASMNSPASFPAPASSLRVQSEHHDPPADDETTLDVLTECTPSGPLPPTWLRAVPTDLRQHVKRLRVVGDGSCADGAIVQAVEQSDHLDSLPISQSLLQPRLRSKDTFRQHEVGAAIAAWTVDDWVRKVPEAFRDEEWNEQRRTGAARPDRAVAGDPEASVRTAEKELEFFRRVLTLPTHAVGKAYLHVAAGVLQHGILLMTMDRRFNRAVYLLDDFGTQQYDSSIILFFNIGPLKPGSRGDGHYETVCLFSPDDGVAHTVFERNHPLLCNIRNWAAKYADSNTMEHERVWLLCHPAISIRPSEEFSGPPAPSGPTTQNAPSASANTGTRPRRPRILPARLRDPHSDMDGSGRASPSGRITPARSLRAAFETAAVAPAPMESQPENPSNRRTPPRGSASSHLAPRGPVEAAPRRPPSDRPAALGESAQRNLRAWVRQRSQRGRLASKVHLSAVPMWTARCRTVLQGLAAALQESPMNEAKVITWLCVLWMLPQEVFTVPGCTRGGKMGRKLRHHRIHHILNDAALLSRLVARAEAGSDSALEGKEAYDHNAAVEHQLNTMATWELQDRSPREAPEHSSVHAGSGAGDGRGVETAPVNGHEEAWPTERNAALRVEHLFRQGHVQRAMRALVSTTGKADLDVIAERAALSALHPPGPSVSELPLCPSDAPELVVDPSWMADEMLHSDTGAAPGPSGYGSNFIQVLAADAACVTAMAVLIGHIVNNKLPPAVRNLLNTCILVSLEKDGGGRRPVAMGDMFYRMAARFALSLVLEPAQRSLRPYQFSVGVEDGCTQVVQSLQHLLCLPPAPASPPPMPQHQPAFPLPRPAPEPVDPSPRPLACLSIDLANAFNSIDRAALLRAVYSNAELALCWRMVAFGYGSPSLLLMPCGDGVAVEDAFLESSNGVRQGDPLAAMLFALAMHGVYEKVAQICRSGCFAYSDDSHGVGWLEECWHAWESLPGMLEPLGLRLNAVKCEVTCFHTDALQHPRDIAALEAFRAAGVAINTRALKVLGCIVGVSDAIIAQELCQRPTFRADQRVAFQRLPLLSKPIGYLALTQLTGTVLTNRLRAMPPSATESHAQDYDREVLRIAHGLVGIREADGGRYDEELRLPVRFGGLGLLSAARIGPAAYLAGAECTLRSSPVFSTVWNTADELESAWPITKGIADGLRRVADVEADFASRCDPEMLAAAEIDASILPATAATFVAHFKALPPSPIQSTVIHRITTLSNIARMTEVGKGGVRARAEVARLRALQEKESSRWLRVVPTDAALRLTDLQWQTAARLRLGMPKTPLGDAAPPCKHVRAAAKDGHHALVCRTRSGEAINKRHHAVVHLLADAAALLKVPARVEPYNLCEDNDSRPDIQLDLPECTLLGDVTISHPSAECWRTAAAERGVEAVGDARSVEKDGTYAPLVKALNADGLSVEFSPFVLYTYGGFHKSALSFIDKLGRAHDPAVALLPLSTWKEELKDRIAISIQRHTANILIDDARQARMASVARRRRGARRSRARRRRPKSRVLPSRRQLAEQLLREAGERAVSLCAPLLSLSSAVSPTRAPVDPVGSDDETQLMSMQSTPLMQGSPAEEFVPETPVLEDACLDAALPVRAMSELSISPACAVVADGYVERMQMSVAPGAGAEDEDWCRGGS